MRHRTSVPTNLTQERADAQELSKLHAVHEFRKNSSRQL